ncbi:hypothetical protein [Nannocystis pusilla]|uniref:hypothetical protein n=1 Tax=Nannocystis pusilla TaxID=889268 RepID=UPI003DA2333D
MYGGALDEALGEGGVRESISAADIEVRSVGADEGDGAGAVFEGEDALAVTSAPSREFEGPGGVARTEGEVREGELSERYDDAAVDASEDDGASAGLEGERGLVNGPESDGEPEPSAPMRAGAEGLEERSEAFLPTAGAPEGDGAPGGWRSVVEGRCSSDRGRRASERRRAAG